MTYSKFQNRCQNDHCVMIALADIFQDELDQVDYALKNNPTHALKLSLESCLKQRNSAVKLNKMGDEVRARRALQYCFDSLNLSKKYVVRVAAPTQEELLALSDQIVADGGTPWCIGLGSGVLVWVGFVNGVLAVSAAACWACTAAVVSVCACANSASTVTALSDQTTSSD